MGKMFDQLKEGLTDAIEHEKGKKTLRAKKIELPLPPKKYVAKDVKALRRKLHCSQHVLALFLNVSPKTVQAWESGDRHPHSSTNRLLEILDSERKRNRFFEAANF